ncbi:hypothetical protein J2Z37_000836 [Ammoniphilus resinae]|uniref:Uncharacterized protein n=1 Tax=Ammoniphilus resinae TaxID=861532 RepID=A0ABS4GKR0_9BACL|nr:hypothetical protein [Ammoniphilus resinae]
MTKTLFPVTWNFNFGTWIARFVTWTKVPPDFGGMQRLLIQNRGLIPRSSLGKTPNFARTNNVHKKSTPFIPNLEKKGCLIVGGIIKLPVW